VRIEPAGQVPIRFEISYAAARIDPKHRYSVRARIARGDALLFTTTQAYLVLTQGAGTEVELLLQRANRPSPKLDRALTETYWKLVQLGDRAVQVAPNQREPHLILRTTGNRVGGSGGCNRIMGSFTLDGPTLSLARWPPHGWPVLKGWNRRAPSSRLSIR
jgi:putative lipoprotein